MNKLPPIFPVVNDNTNPETYNKQIVNLLTNKNCAHSDSYHNGLPNNNYICMKICDIISVCHSSNKKISQDVITAFITLITKTNYYPTSSCIDKNSTGLKETIGQLFKYYVPAGLFINYIITDKDYDSCYKNLFENENFKCISSDSFDKIISHRLLYSEDENCNELVDFLLKYTIINQDSLLKLAPCRNEYLSFQLAGIIDKTTEQINQKVFDKLCVGLPYTKHTVRSLLMKGFQFTEMHLEQVCGSCNKDGIEFVLNTSRIPPNTNHLKKLITSLVYKKPKSDQNSRHFNPYKSKQADFIESVKGFSLDKMELLIKYGYQPTYEDVIFGIKNKIELPDVERFGIKLDKKILELCWEYDFYPSYKFDCIDPNMIELQKLCLTKKTTDMKQLIKKSNIIPDKKCMENACGFKNNLPIVNILSKAGGGITYKCIKNCAKQFPANTFLMNCIDEYEKNHNENIKILNEKIKTLDEQILKLSGNSENVVIPEIKVCQSKGKIGKLGKRKKNIIVNDDESLIENKKKPSKKNIELIDNEDFDDKEEEEILKNLENKINENKEDKIKKILNLSIHDEQIQEIQKDMNVKKIIKGKFDKITNVFGNEIGKTVSYLDVKKNLVKEINKNLWFDKNDKNLIDFPKKLRDQLGLDKEGYVVFSDIDKIVCLFFI